MGRYGVLYSPWVNKAFPVDNDWMRYTRMRKAVHSWAEILKPLKNVRMVMLGLTYRPGQNWHKLDISNFMLSMRKRLGKRLLAYSWVSELQERGIIHYHVLLVVPKGCYVPFPDKFGLWTHGSSHYSEARSPFYMVSYTKKKFQKDYSNFPPYCHAFAVWISDSVMSRQLRYLRLPAWKREILDKYGPDQYDELVQWHKEDTGWGYRSALDWEDAESWVVSYMFGWAEHPPGEYAELLEFA